MRLAYAKWLVEFVEEHGLGLEKGEYAEWQEAEFRVHGPASLPRAEVLPVSSNVEMSASVPAWEAEILACVSHELAEVLFAADADGGSDER